MDVYLLYSVGRTRPACLMLSARSGKPPYERVHPKMTYFGLFRYRRKTKIPMLTYRWPYISLYDNARTNSSSLTLFILHVISAA
jgi:hypothetical protein